MAVQHSYGKMVTDGLVLYLNAADANSYVSGSTTWFDLAGSNNGTLINGPTYNSANFGSIVFDGVDDYVSGSNLLNGSNQATLCGWVKKTSTSNQISFGVLDYGASLPTDKRIEIVWYSDGKLYGEVGNTENDWVNAIPSLNNTNWHFICFTYDGTQPTNFTKITLYFDGITQTNSSQSGTIQSIISTTGPMIIGKRNTGYNTGNIAQVLFYNRALSAAEVLQNYNATKTRFGLT